MAARKVQRTRLGFEDTDFIKTARSRFSFADDNDSKQRKRERDDLSFYDGEGQWPADVKLARQGQQPTNGMPAVPSRPTLVINNTREPVHQITSEAQNADLGVEIVPANDFGDLGILPDDKEIMLREGLVRKIQRESQARDARLWAFDRAVKAGRGYYQILTRYLPGKTNDQEVYVHRIYNQASVLLDPSHEEPDGSDAKWAFVCVDMLWEDYKAKFPKAANGRDNRLATASISDTEWQILGEDYPDWFKNSDGSSGDAADKSMRAVRVVDYWYTEHTTRELSTLSDGTVVWSDELPPDDVLESADLAVIDTREVTQQTIKWAKIDGVQVLEETDWLGPDMPIIKVLGEEMQPFDGEWRAEGIIRPMRDPQMGLNFMISREVEMIGTAPLSPLIVDADAIEGYPEWDQANTRVVPYLRARKYDDQGRQLPEPHRPQTDPNLLAVSQAITLFGAQIEKTSRVPAARLGDIDPVTRSGKALDRLTANSKNSTGSFMQNLLRSVRYEGQVENNLLYPVYGARPGRLVRVLTGKGKPDVMMVHDAPTQMTPHEQQLAQRASQVAKLTEDASFNVNIKITRDFDTAQDEEHAMLGEIFGADPQTFSWFAPIWFRTGHMPGAEELAEIAEVMAPPPVQALLAAKKQGQDPPSPRERLLQQQLRQAQAQLQQAGQIIQTKQIETQAKGQIDLQRTAMQEHAETQRSREDNETKLAVAELGAKVDRLSLFLEERGRLGVQIAEASEANAQRAHEAAMASADQSHQVGMAHAQAGVDAQQADQERQAQMAQQQMAAQQPESAGA